MWDQCTFKLLCYCSITHLHADTQDHIPQHNLLQTLAWECTAPCQKDESTAGNLRWKIRWLALASMFTIVWITTTATDCRLMHYRFKYTLRPARHFLRGIIGNTCVTGTLRLCFTNTMDALTHSWAPWSDVTFKWQTIRCLSHSSISDWLRLDTLVSTHTNTCINTCIIFFCAPTLRSHHSGLMSSSSRGAAPKGKDACLSCRTDRLQHKGSFEHLSSAGYT